MAETEEVTGLGERIPGEVVPSCPRPSPRGGVGTSWGFGGWDLVRWEGNSELSQKFREGRAMEKNGGAALGGGGNPFPGWLGCLS